MDQQKENIFRRIAQLLKEGPSQLALLLLFLLLFSWPYLSFLQQASSATLFGYFFITWLILVAVLWASNRGGEDNGNNKQ